MTGAAQLAADARAAKARLRLVDPSLREEVEASYDAVLLKRLVPYLEPHATLLIISLLLMPVAAALGLAQPYLVKRAIDAMIVVHDGARIHLTVSVGVAERGLDEAPDAWVERADRALYAAKAGGRDQVHIAA